MYYCKHCGQPYMTDEAVICVRCNAPKGKGTNFCHNCGARLAENAEVCMTCGVPTLIRSANAKSKIAAGLLGVFLGCFGAHNFYLGYKSKAITQLVISIVGLVLSCVGIGVLIVLGVHIWGLVEGIMIFAGNIDRDADGELLGD